MRMPPEDWRRLSEALAMLPEFRGFDAQGSPAWYGFEKEGGPFLWASVEPSGLLVEGRLEDSAWEKWEPAFIAKASAALGFAVKDAEE